MGEIILLNSLEVRSNKRCSPNRLSKDDSTHSVDTVRLNYRSKLDRYNQANPRRFKRKGLRREVHFTPFVTIVCWTSYRCANL